MIKNLRNILTLSLALLSTVSFAQDWSVDSRTRANMSGENSKMLVDQRATISTSLGGDNWGVHLSSDVNFQHQDGSNGMIAAGVYEAYAKTNLFNFADLTIGRQAWDFGSGALIGSNQWAAVRTTRDGMLFDIDNDMVDLSIGYSLYNAGGEGEEDVTYTLINASKSFGDITANALVIQEDIAGFERTATGLDLGYSAMGGALDLMLGVNTLTQGDMEMEMTMIGATYSVSDNLSVRASQTAYGDQGFAIDGGTNMGITGVDQYGNYYDSWVSHGNLGYLNKNDENLSIGLDYSMGGFDISYTMHTITNSETDYEAEASEVSIGYNLNDNASLSLKYANDNRINNDGEDYMWLTLTVAP